MTEAAPWGIVPGYHDAAGRWHDTSPETGLALLASMRPPEGAASPPYPDQPTWFVRVGERHRLQTRCDVTLEDGTEIEAVDELPPDLPLGYHLLHPDDGGPTTRLVVSPGRCHLDPDLHTWGWAVQLYAARSAASWGIGDFADLRALAGWSRQRGAGVLVVNPLHAATPVVPQEPSPYFPSSRVFRNPLYLRIEELPGATDLVDDLEPLAARARVLNATDHIERDEVLRLKMDALRRLWAGFRSDPAFDAYVAEQGDLLSEFATYCVVAEEHGADWHDWPSELRHPASPAVTDVGARAADRVRFHAWVQWLLDRQLETAAEGVALVQDLAIGFDPAGADAWLWQDCLALDVRVGAPPDEFNTQGQDWGLPPFVPWRLRAAGYEPFARTMRAALGHAGGLRVDHVMGLFRLFWIPPGCGPGAGTYVRYPAGDLLDLLALESVRAGAFVVGEDLGTVEDEVRRELYERDVLSYRLVWFEDGPPARYPERALAAVTTHDLPTIAGLWNGADLAAQRELGLEPNEDGTRAMRDRLRTLVGVDDDAPVDEVVVGTYSALAGAPSTVVVATLDDALGVEERPNMPGTTDEWPNWSIPLPVPLDEALRDQRVEAVARALNEGRTGTS